MSRTATTTVTALLGLTATVVAARSGLLAKLGRRTTVRTVRPVR